MKFLSTLVILATLSVFTEALNADHVQRSSHNRIARRGRDDGTNGQHQGKGNQIPPADGSPSPTPTGSPPPPPPTNSPPPPNGPPPNNKPPPSRRADSGSPAPGKNDSPAPGKNDSPAPGKNDSPAPAKNNSPPPPPPTSSPPPPPPTGSPPPANRPPPSRRAGNDSPANNNPAPAKNNSPAPAKNDSPPPANSPPPPPTSSPPPPPPTNSPPPANRPLPSRRAGNDSPAPAKNNSPAPAKNDSPPPANSPPPPPPTSSPPPPPPTNSPPTPNSPSTPNNPSTPNSPSTPNRVSTPKVNRDANTNTNSLIQGPDNSCGSPGAVQQVSHTAGPNGAIDWMNCGVEGSGWNPPQVTISDIVTVDLDDAIAKGGPFTNCSEHVSAFKQYGEQFGLPPILLATIALQKSSCNPASVGSNSEQGLMQLTSDKCSNAPSGNCQDVDFNVMTGAQYFSDQLAGNNNSFFLTLGSYNGWKQGMTVADATSQRNTDCRAQNNLDYLGQTVNGLLLNNDPNTSGIGKYFNLDSC